jgi:ribonuclease HII
MNPLLINDLSFLAKHGLKHAVGLDEAGRGALAGPVVIAAVVLDYKVDLPLLNDSKLLSAARRETLYMQIVASALAFRIVEIPESVIDEINILQATFRGFQKAYAAVKGLADYALVDGRDLPAGVSGMAVVKGDSCHACIAAASILAKVHRDRVMEGLAPLYPEYGFAQHKGYGTKAHYSALGVYGSSPVHRKSFRLF